MSELSTSLALVAATSALISALLGIGLALYLVGRCNGLERRVGELEGVVASLRARLDAIESGAAARQLQQAMREALAMARGFMSENDQLRDKVAYAEAETREARMRLEHFARSFGNGATPLRKVDP